MLELWGMWSTPSLLSLPSSLWPRRVAPDRVLSMVRIELNHWQKHYRQDKANEPVTTKYTSIINTTLYDITDKLQFLIWIQQYYFKRLVGMISGSNGCCFGVEDTINIQLIYLLSYIALINGYRRRKWTRDTSSNPGRD